MGTCIGAGNYTSFLWFLVSAMITAFFVLLTSAFMIFYHVRDRITDDTKLSFGFYVAIWLWLTSLLVSLSLLNTVVLPLPFNHAFDSFSLDLLRAQHK